jgi:acetylornithine/succinyldiaminopimelate/putrescine aminotransferase
MSHGSTFGGNLLACAARRRADTLRDEHLPEQAAEKGAYLLAPAKSSRR